MRHPLRSATHAPSMRSSAYASFLLGALSSVMLLALSTGASSILA